MKEMLIFGDLFTRRKWLGKRAYWLDGGEVLFVWLEYIRGVANKQ